MHYLDSLIDDLEPRITEILDNPSNSKASIQTSLVAYCWILIDSWIAWNTYRFLLRDAIIDQKISDKWLHTPSSYSGSQLKAIWRFSEEEESYFKMETGTSIKHAIDEVIQPKRNASAHFKKNLEGMIRGDDIHLISSLFNCFSKMFRFIEIKCFVERIQTQLLFASSVFIEKVSFYDQGNEFEVVDFDSHFSDFINCNVVRCDLSNHKGLFFDKKTRQAFIVSPSCATNKEIDNSYLGYNIFGSKGYYLDVKPILQRIVTE